MQLFDIQDDGLFSDIAILLILVLTHFISPNSLIFPEKEVTFNLTDDDEKYFLVEVVNTGEEAVGSIALKLDRFGFDFYCDDKPYEFEKWFGFFERSTVSGSLKSTSIEGNYRIKNFSYEITNLLSNEYRRLACLKTKYFDLDAIHLDLNFDVSKNLQKPILVVISRYVSLSLLFVVLVSMTAKVGFPGFFRGSLQGVFLSAKFVLVFVDIGLLIHSSL